MKRSIEPRSYSASASEVEPGAEELGVRRGEHHAADTVVARQLRRGGGQRLHERLVDRVAARLVEPQHGEPPVALQAHTRS